MSVCMRVRVLLHMCVSALLCVAYAHMRLFCFAAYGPVYSLFVAKVRV